MTRKESLRKKREALYQQYGHLIGCKTEDIPEEHRASVGGLRCFRKNYRRINGEKQTNQPKRRCRKPCSKGSLYCSHHGGGNTKNLVHGNRAKNLYRTSFKSDLCDVFDAFLSDDDIMDHKKELSTLRTVLINYINVLSNNDGDTLRPRRIVEQIENTVNNVRLDHNDKYIFIKQIIDSQQSLTDGHVIDRINKLIENIGKSLERIDKLEKKSDFMLTPEGMKIMLRSIFDIIKGVVVSQDSLKEIKEGLMSISIATGGDLSKVKKTEALTVNSKEIVEDDSNN